MGASILQFAGALIITTKSKWSAVQFDTIAVDGHLPHFNELCDWANGLDWRNNDAHFVVLAQRVVDSLDDELREKEGMRLDQTASRDELMRAMRYAASWYKPEYRSIFIHLRLLVYLYLGDKLGIEKGAARKFPDFENAT